MLRIGEFSKLSQLTIKALRFYEREGLLVPAQTDAFTGYRFYETSQLETAGKIKAYRQLGLSLSEIRAILHSTDGRSVLFAKAEALHREKADIDIRLTIIHHLLEEHSMQYTVTIKEIPEAIVYSCEKTIASCADLMRIIPQIGAECLALNPILKCAEPPYEFCEYLDGEYRATNIRVRHSEAVTAMGKGNESISFHALPASKVLSIYHKGPYETIGAAYAYICKYAEENGYTVSGLARECYIDGIWNKETSAEWLTEIQLPIA